MMYNDVDGDLPPFNDQIDGDEIFLFSNTKTSSTGASFLNDDDDDHQLRHHNNGASTSSHHLPVDVDELLLNSNFLEQPHCDTTEDPLFWNCKDISDDQLNEIWPQNQLNLNGNTNLTINNNNNGNSSNNHQNNLNLNQSVSLGPTTSSTNCNNNTQHQHMHNGIIINHQQPHLISQVQQHSQQTIINIQHQQQQQQHQLNQQLHQQNHGLATLISQPSQISQLQQQQQQHHDHQQQQQQQQQQHLQLRLQQNDQIAHIHQQALQNVLQSQQQQLLQQQTGFQQPQQVIQHVDSFQNKWITLVAANDQFQTFNTIPPQQQLNNQQQVAQFFDKSSHTIIQTDNGSITAQIPINSVITTAPQQVVLQASGLQQRAQQQQPSITLTAQQLQNRQNAQEPQSQRYQQQQKPQPPKQQPQKKQSQKQAQQQQPTKSKVEGSKKKAETATPLDNGDSSKKETAAAKINKPKEKPTCLNCPYCKRSFSKNFDLQQHMRCHTGEKPFQCIVCGRGFAQKSNVKKHMQAHKVWPEGPNNPTMPTNLSPARSRNNSASSGLTRDDECMQENESVHIKNELSSGTALGLSTDRKNDGSDMFAENRYSCSYCQFNGKTYFELKSHLTIHKREKVFKCIVSSCGKTFSGSDLQGFLDHVTGHKDLIYHCHLCSGQFYSLDEFGEHQKHHSSAQIKKSGQSQNSSSNTNQHQAQNLSKPTTASLRQQNQQVAPPPPPPPTHLQPQQHQRQYNQQQSINFTPQPANNQKAPKILNNARLKNNHKYFRCSKCMNRYTTQTALDHHLSISTHNFPCTECNKVFMCERYLRRHLNTHTAVQHVCTFCDKQFKTAAYLKMHSVVHTGEKPFRCNQCEAAFNRRDKLSRHKLTHETVKKFKCPFRPKIGCTKEFNRPDKLKAHVLTHSGVRPHPCDACTRTFSRLSRLREHKKLHHDNNNNTVKVKPVNGSLAATADIDILKQEVMETDGGNKEYTQGNSNRTIINTVSSMTNIDIVNGGEKDTNANNSIMIIKS